MAGPELPRGCRGGTQRCRLWACRALPPAGGVPGLALAPRGCKVRVRGRRRPGSDVAGGSAVFAQLCPQTSRAASRERSVPTAQRPRGSWRVTLEREDVTLIAICRCPLLGPPPGVPRAFA